ncbi:unnamed protein product [Nesidiocoris tenuis]|uniref:FAD-binding PCMH-type domain-containing protein n=1 Tax=Nesidiocoris tenuis TaxID=355587 RepID=A0A6H5HG35_9HEMI|nr:unnamed protein product [Nesidiocoris tenuis]
MSEIYTSSICTATGDLPPNTSLNTFIREHVHLKGTKFMCLEGGCGACIVSVQSVHPKTGKNRSYSVNSCLIPVFACHGWSVTTIEGLGSGAAGYHNFQKRLAAASGSQCGYCSPGMVMNMNSLMEMNPKMKMAELENSFGGNICRCTGYRPILDAFKSFAGDAPSHLVNKLRDIEDTYFPEPSRLCDGSSCGNKCGSIVCLPKDPKNRVFLNFGNGQNWYRPVNLKEIFELFDMIGDSSYQLVVGNTGQGVYRNSDSQKVYIDLNGIGSLFETAVSANGISIGGNVSLNEAMELFRKTAKDQTQNFGYCDQLADHIDMIANVPVRNVMPRAQNAHAHINAGFLCKVDKTKNYQVIEKPRIVFGGINPHFVSICILFIIAFFSARLTFCFAWQVHASKTEEFLTGKPLLDNQTIKEALEILQTELNPNLVLPDPSPDYRKGLAVSLLYKFVLSLNPNAVNERNKSGSSLLTRSVSSGRQDFDTDRSRWPVNQPVPKLEGLMQCADDVKYKVKGQWVLKSQYHFTMETLSCVAVPKEGAIEIHLTSQYPASAQSAVSNALKIPLHRIDVIVRRLGGAYGIKCDRPNHTAVVCSLAAYLLHRPVRMVLSLETNMEWTGKRLPAHGEYEAGVSDSGEIQYLNASLYQDNGHLPNAFMAHYSLLHADNGYDPSTFNLKIYGVITDNPWNTWCRAPGSTEFTSLMENLMEHIAKVVNKDPVSVRLVNLVKDTPLPGMINDLKKSSDFSARQKNVDDFNKSNRWKKRGINLSTMRYPYEFWAHYHASISIFSDDGSIAIAHGGIEMGQGINTKAAQVAARFLGVDMNMITVKPVTTHENPNNSPTAGCQGSDCVSYAIMMCCMEINKRLAPVREKIGKKARWTDVVKEAAAQAINLKCTHMFSPKDNVKPYNIYGVVVTEVEIDVLTGQYQIKRVDLLEDAGQSISPEVDIGQIEGAFMMGMGYYTSEDIIHNHETGALMSNRSWNYKPPGAKDIPEDFRITLRKKSSNPYGTLGSKATGEPALCLSCSIPLALRYAIDSARRDAGLNEIWFEMSASFTSEQVQVKISVENWNNFEPPECRNGFYSTVGLPFTIEKLRHDTAIYVYRRAEPRVESVSGRGSMTKLLKRYWPYFLVPTMMTIGYAPFILMALKMFVMKVMMFNMMAFNAAIFMTLRNLVFGPRSGGHVKYYNYGYQHRHSKQTESLKNR